ncbi:MAG: cupredoxin domain-containing protein [Actinomycetota bacterium]
MDPEQIYQEVLQEEQQKGSAAPVAEGRAKAARSRAEHGSPHPKEPKWWPGSQPHLEGGDGAAAEEAPAEEAVAQQPAAEEPAAEEPAAEEPAAEEAAAEEETAAPAAEAAPEPEPAAAQPAAQTPAQPAAEAPAQSAPEAPAQQPAAAAAPAATATQTLVTTGVSHGTATGNRMRPEDGVASPAQLDGQQAMYERRRLIDEVIKTGVPAAAAAQRDSSGSGALAVLYLLIPLLVIGFLVLSSDDDTATPAGAGANEAVDEQSAGDAEGTNTVVAVNTAFETEELSAEAGGTVAGTLDNQDGVDHNIAFYESEDDLADPAAAFYTSETAAGGETVDFEFTAPEEPGEYPFLCDFHPTTMEGVLLVGASGGADEEGAGGNGQGGGDEQGEGGDG